MATSWKKKQKFECKFLTEVSCQYLKTSDHQRHEIMHQHNNETHAFILFILTITKKKKLYV